MLDSFQSGKIKSPNLSVTVNSYQLLHVGLQLMTTSFGFECVILLEARHLSKSKYIYSILFYPIQTALFLIHNKLYYGKENKP